MRKKIVILMLAMCMALTAAACGNQKEDAKTEDTKKEGSGSTAEVETRLTTVSAGDLDKYVKVGEYKGIKLDNAVAEVTDDEVEAQIQSAMQDTAEELKDADAKVENGDIVNIDYEGTLNGEAFEGGTDQGFDLTIGSGSFIEGFEEGLIGAKKGEERDLNLTFPKEYPSADLAGQETVFHVKVNAIKRPVELTEEWVKENTGYASIEEYKESIRKNLEENNKVSADNTLKSTAWSTVYESSEILEFPQADIDREVAAYNDLMEQYAKQSETSLEELLKSSNMTQEDLDKQSQEYAETMVKQNLVVQYILDKEGLSFSGDAGQEALDELLSEYGVGARDELITQFGELAVNESIGVIIVGNYVMDNAVVEDVVNTADGKNGVDDDAEAESAD